MKKSINIALAIALFYMLYQHVNPKIFFDMLKNVNINYIPFIFLFTIASIMSNGYVTNRLTLKLFNIETNFRTWFGLSAANAFANLVTPMRSGTLFRAIYLKKKHNFEISKSGGIFIFSNALSIATLITASTFIIFKFPSEKLQNIAAENLALGPTHKIITITACAILISTITLIAFYRTKENHSNCDSELHRNTLKNKLKQLASSLALMANSPTLIASHIINTILNLAFNMIILYVAFLAINQNVSAIEITFINLLTTLTFYFSLTPGNIGVQELTIASISMFLGIPFEQGLLASIIIRASSSFITICVGWFFINRLSDDLWRS